MPKKYVQVKVNFYPSQHQLLKSEATKNNQTIAQYIRQKLDLNLEEKDTRKIYKEHEKIIHKKADPKLIYELAKIGTNLNQIAKQLNQKKDVNNIEILETLLRIETKINEIKK